MLLFNGIFISGVTAPGLTNLFIQNIFSKHRVLSHVTLDRRAELILEFFRSLAQVLNMKLYFSAEYYPETDNQTKRTNQTLKQYLQTYCNY